MLRVTDAATRPGAPARSFTTPSAAHQLAWNATSDRFYVRSIDGTFIPYDFNAPSMRASRIAKASTGDGGLTIVSQVEPQFSFISRDVMFVSAQHSATNTPVVRRFDFSTLAYTDLVNLNALSAVDANTYAGALSSSAGFPERVSVIYGGQQDTHYKVAVFDVDPAGANAAVLNTAASWIERNGVRTATNVTLGFNLHHAWIDKSGGFVVLYPTGAQPVPFFVWDLATDAITAVSTNADGHDALGFRTQVNQSCCTSSSYDAAQWQYRELDRPATTTDLINPVLTPREVYMADHTSWNNAVGTRLAPVLSATYRYYEGTLNTTPWRAWDDEIIAIQTDTPGSGATVWRFAHHRSDIRYDGNPNGIYFWYLPRAIISPDGRFALFTSNWEKSLGSAAGAEPGGAFRTDVFVAALTRTTLNAFINDPLAGVTIRAAHIHELHDRIDALRLRHAVPQRPPTDRTLRIATRSAYLAALRRAVEEIFAALGQPSPAFTETRSEALAVQIEELRDAIVRLELLP